MGIPARSVVFFCGPGFSGISGIFIAFSAITSKRPAAGFCRIFCCAVYVPKFPSDNKIIPTLLKVF